MKKKMIDYLTKKRNALVAKRNTLSGEELAAVDAALAEIDGLLDELKAAEEDVTALEALRKIVDALTEKISAIEEKIRQEAQDGGSSENYLASANALHDYMESMRGANSVEEFRRNWMRRLSENGIVIESGTGDAYLPEAVKGRIEDAWNDDANWLRELNNTGAKLYYARFNEGEQDGADVTAKFWPVPGEGTKSEQTLTLDAKKIEAQFVYKILGVDNKTIWDNDEALLTYVVDELFKQWRYTVAREILIGGSQYSQVESINRATTDAFVTVSGYDSSVELIDQIVSAVESIYTGDGSRILLFATKKDINKLRRVMLSSSSTPQYVSREVIAEQLGVSRIIEFEGLTELSYSGSHSTGLPSIILMRPDKYTTVGSIDPEMVQWEDYKANVTYYRVEIPFGGAVTGIKSAAVIMNPANA